MIRRTFLGVLSGAAAWPIAAPAQKSEGKRRIGVLQGRASTDPQGQSQVQAFEQALSLLGWTRDRNVQIDYRWASGNPERITAFAKEFVSDQRDVIVAQTTSIVAALLAETRTLPIVFVAVTDPVASGFVDSFSKPGGNATGFIDLEPSLGGKWVELLIEMHPQLSRVGCIFNPETAAGGGSLYLRPFENAARSLGVEAIAQPVHDVAGIERAITALAREPVGGLIVMPDIFNGVHRDLIVSLAAREGVPAIYAFQFFPKAGGLVSYGVDLLDLYRRAASYVDRILRGVKPAELPVQLPTRFELVINLKTAKALGLNIPPTLLARADEVIE